jgi:hypothetical protein
MLVAPLLTPPAHADHDWFSIGTAFRVGAAHISFVFGQPSFLYQPAYFYRYDRPIHYRGHRCSRSCFHDAGYYYHHQSCPLVNAHFSHYGVDPYWAFDRYAPRYDRRRGGGDYDRYDRRGHDRYDDRRHDRRYDRRYDRDRYDRYDDDDHGDRGHGRRRDHRHHRGCGHGD